MKEVIKDYFATEDGQIWSNKTHKYVAQRISPSGYYHVNLSIDGKCRTFQVHRLIAKAFLDATDVTPIINHKDGNKLNNHVTNLEWCTYQYNTQHAETSRLTHHAVGVNSRFGKFSEEDISNIRQLRNHGLSQYQIANMYNVTRSSIQQILDGKNYKWVT